MTVCVGHECDDCRTCLRGRCCRRDNGAYALPLLGSWQPVHGQIGVRNVRDEGMECHACGGWFRSVAHHAWLAHDLTGDEYRAVFGLSQRGLVGGLERERRSRLTASMVASGVLPARGNFTKENQPTHEQLMAAVEVRRTRPEVAAIGLRAIQTRLSRDLEDPVRMAARRDRALRALDVAHEHWTPDVPRRSGATRQARNATTRQCEACGSPYTLPSWDPRKHCGTEACRAEIRRRGYEVAGAKTRARLLADPEGLARTVRLMQEARPAPKPHTPESRARMSEVHRQRWAVRRATSGDHR